MKVVKYTLQTVIMKTNVRNKWEIDDTVVFEKALSEILCSHLTNQVYLMTLNFYEAGRTVTTLYQSG